jgi:HEPN domain-containing protein
MAHQAIETSLGGGNLAHKRPAPVQWGYQSFVWLADEFLISYACAPNAGKAALFNIGHAVELYLKAVLVKANSKKDVSDYGHNIEELLTVVQSSHAPLLSRYVLKKGAFKWLHNTIAPEGHDADYEHYRNHQELYWLSRYLVDTKYLFASHRQIKGSFALIYCSLNEYWQPFFREIRQHLGIPNSESGPDVLAIAARDSETPPYARKYLSKML